MGGVVKEKKILDKDNDQDPNLEHFIWSPGPLPLPLPLPLPAFQEMIRSIANCVLELF